MLQHIPGRRVSMLKIFGLPVNEKRFLHHMTHGLNHNLEENRSRYAPHRLQIKGGDDSAVRLLVRSLLQYRALWGYNPTNLIRIPHPHPSPPPPPPRKKKNRKRKNTIEVPNRHGLRAIGSFKICKTIADRAEPQKAAQELLLKGTVRRHLLANIGYDIPDVSSLRLPNSP